MDLSGGRELSKTDMIHYILEDVELEFLDGILKIKLICQQNLYLGLILFNQLFPLRKLVWVLVQLGPLKERGLLDFIVMVNRGKNLFSLELLEEYLPILLTPVKVLLIQEETRAARFIHNLNH